MSDDEGDSEHSTRSVDVSLLKLTVIRLPFYSTPVPLTGAADSHVKV